MDNGNGLSVQEVIDTAREVTGKEIKVIEAPRREGDTAVLLADATLVKTELNWKPQYSKLLTIIEDAWRWELNYYH